MATALAALAVEPVPTAAGAPIPEIAGPRAEYLPDIVQLLAARRGDKLIQAQVDLTVISPAQPAEERAVFDVLLDLPGAQRLLLVQERGDGESELGLPERFVHMDLVLCWPKSTGPGALTPESATVSWVAKISDMGEG